MTSPETANNIIVELIGFLVVITAALVGFSGVIWAQRKGARSALQRDDKIRRDDAEALAFALRGEITAIQAALANRRDRFADLAGDHTKKNKDLSAYAGMLRMPPKHVYPANTDRLGLLGSKLPQQITLFYAQIGLLDETTAAALRGDISLQKRSAVFGEHVERASALLKDLEDYLEGELLSERPLDPIQEDLDRPQSGEP